MRNLFLTKDAGTVEAALGGGQKLVIQPDALAHMLGHRQCTPWSREAGGQLFGTVGNQQVVIDFATGPYRGDERSRYSYRSNPAAAQQAINRLHSRGYQYVGEWHTHAEEKPHASGSDRSAMRSLADKSVLTTSGLILIVVGQAPLPQGIATYLFVDRSLQEVPHQFIRRPA